jgi:hypothetical protein
MSALQPAAPSRPAAESPGGAFSSSLEATGAVLDVLETQLPGSLVYVARLEQETRALRVVAVGGDGPVALAPGDELPAGSVERPATALRRLGAASSIGVPLELSSGERVGSLGAAQAGPDSYDAADLSLLRMLARVLVSELERETRELELERRTFDETLRREWQLAKRGTLRSQLAVLAGDEERDAAEVEAPGVRLGRALRAVARATDVIARLDDTRFAVVLVGCPTERDARDFRRRLAAELGSTPAMGVEGLEPATSPQAALSAAERALDDDRERLAAGGRSRLGALLGAARRRTA